MDKLFEGTTTAGGFALLARSCESRGQHQNPSLHPSFPCGLTGCALWSTSCALQIRAFEHQQFGFGLGDSKGKETRLILPVMLLFLHNGSALRGDELSSHPHCGCGTGRGDDQDNNQQKTAETSTLQQQAARVAFLAKGLRQFCHLLVLSEPGTRVWVSGGRQVPVVHCIFQANRVHVKASSELSFLSMTAAWLVLGAGFLPWHGSSSSCTWG